MDRLTQGDRPRQSASYSFASMDSNRSRAAATSSTCQYKMTPPGPGAEEAGA